MKFTFKVEGKKVFTHNYNVLKKYIISEEVLKIGLRHKKTSIWDLLSHKKLYLTVPYDQKNDADYRTIMAFIVRRADGTIMVWSNQYLYIENNDVIFTTKEEADTLKDKHNDYNNLRDLQAFAQAFADSCDEIATELAQELGKK